MERVIHRQTTPMGVTVTLKSAPAEFIMEKLKNKQSETQKIDDNAKTKPNKQEKLVQRADQASKTKMLSGKENTMLQVVQSINQTGD